MFLVGECTKSPIYLSKIENEYQIVNSNPLDMEATLLNRVKSGCFMRHSCNGLICIACPVDKLSADSFWCQVYNPCTHQYVSIPRPNIREISGYLSAVNLAFDPSKSNHFKIIGIWENMIKFSFFIYSSKTRLWKDAGVSLDARFYRYNFFYHGASQYFFRNGVFLNGNLHWVSNTKPFLCFDTVAERFEPMPSTPVVPSESRNIRYFGASGGHLHLIEDEHNHSSIFNVLALRRDYSEWYSKCKVDTGFVTKLYPRLRGEYGDLNVLSALCEKDEEKKMKLVLSVPGKIISCDVDEETVSELFDVQPERSCYKWNHAYHHFESLFMF